MTDLTTARNRTVDRMQVKLDHLDTLLSLAGEVIITAANLQDLERRANATATDGGNLGDEGRSLIKTANQSTRRISQDLHNLVMAIRLVEIEETFRLLRRPARDLSRNLGRDVEVAFEGSETAIDKALAERLLDPLLHLLRNAIDHGIEPSIDRKRAGKDVTGRVRFVARDNDHETVITVEDDGRGIDEPAVRAVARDRLGSGWDDQPLLTLLCQPGLTTTSEVTGTSGRGVGLDLVRTVVDEFDGDLDLETRIGEGTRFTLTIPKLRAVNIIDALTLRSGEILYALPIDKVVANLGLARDEVNTAFDRGRHITYQGRIVPLHDLQDSLEEPSLEVDQAVLPVIVLRGRSGEAAFQVSEFLGPQKLVNIPLDEGLDHHPAVAGTTVFTGGKLGLTLDVDTLVAMALGLGAEREIAERLVDTVGDVVRSDDTGVAACDREPGPRETDSPSATENDETEDLQHELLTSLERLQDSLISLESDPDDREELHHAFRRLHAAKGHFSVLEAEPQAILAHHLETALDYLRAGRLALSAERMDLLLDGVSYLMDAARELPAPPEAFPTEIMATLQELTASETVAAEDGRELADLVRQPFNLTPTAQLQVLSALKRGERTYETYLSFDPGRQPSFLAAYLLLSRIGKSGTVLATLPEASDIEQGRCGPELKILWSINLDDVDPLLDRLAPLYRIHEHNSVRTTIFRYEGGQEG
jgi:chemotaxis protein histidine kinase CheA